MYNRHDTEIMSAARSMLRKRNPRWWLPRSRSLRESEKGFLSKKDTELHRDCESSAQQLDIEVVFDLQTPFLAPHNSTQGTYTPASSKVVKGNHVLASREYLVSKRKKSRINAIPGTACKAGESRNREHAKI